MNFSNLITSMVPSLKRNDLLDDLDATRKIAKEVTKPLYERAAFLQKHKWKSKGQQQFQKEWEKAYRGNKGNWVAATSKTVDACLENSDVIGRLIGRYMSDETYREAMSFLKANLTAYATYMGFYVRYATLALNNACAEEAIAENPDAEIADVKPGDKRWLMENAERFAQLDHVLNRKANKLKSDLEKVPDTVIDPDQVAYQMSMLGRKNTDPLEMGFVVPGKFNPVLWIQTAWADWQHDRYESAQQEKITVELRLANLEAMLKGTPSDDNVVRQIGYQQERLDKLNRKLREYEETIDV